VASGLGRYFSVDPVIFRIGFAISLFFGGLGAIAYVALALFVPDEDGKIMVGRSRGVTIAAIIVLAAIAAPILGVAFSWHGFAWPILWILLPIGLGVAVYTLIRERGGSATPLRVLAAGALVVAMALALTVLMALALFATATGHGLAIAVLVIAAGALIAGLAMRGGARLLIAPALALAMGVGVAAAADLDWHGGIGQRDYRPLTASAIPADGYELGIGRLAVDLRGIDWHRGRVVSLRTRLGVGETVIAVPQNVCVDATTHTGAGDTHVLGVHQSGWDVDNDQNAGSNATPRLVLDASQDAGELQVVNDDAFDITSHSGWRNGLDSAALRDASAKACAPAPSHRGHAARKGTRG
jgi:phage shock protein PspC (stress-responsive transcriptional regulator)